MADEITMVGADGTLTEEFRTALPGYLGDGHKEYKGLDDVKTLSGLCKFAADNHVAARKQVDGHVKIPGDGATDEERAEFKTKTMAALGLAPPDSSEGYEFPEMEGLKTNAQSDAELKQTFHKVGMSKAMATDLINLLNAQKVQDNINEAVAKKQAFDDQVTILKADPEWLGDKLPVNLREVYNLMVGVSDPVRKDALQKSGLYGNPTNFEEWAKQDVAPSELSTWFNIHKMIKGSTVGDGDGGGSPADTHRQGLEKRYDASPELHQKASA